ncbi:hypothetical protein RBB50_009974 [Rhinocladiella similis]
MQETPTPTTSTSDTMTVPTEAETKRASLLAQIEETEKIIRDLTRGKSLKEIGKERGIPTWKLGLRIAHYGLDCKAIAMEGLQFPSRNQHASRGLQPYIVKEALVEVMHGKSPRNALRVVYDELEDLGIVLSE